eukprot:873979_1
MPFPTEIQGHWEKELKSVLNGAGYIKLQKISNTLQGAVYKAVQLSTKTEVAIKITHKYLHNKSATLLPNQKLIPVSENIISESIILKHLTTNKLTPKSIVKFIDLLQCDINYYLVMEYFGTQSLFEFISQGHKLITEGYINAIEWNSVIKVIFKQMIECIKYIHSKRVSHFDISLENFVINDVQVNMIPNENSKIPKVEFDLDSIQIKLIDFGLAEMFSKNDTWQTCRYVGKNNYKSPEIHSKKRKYNSKSNDIWCMGICLFMCLFGMHPWQLAGIEDGSFDFVFIKHNGNVSKLLKAYNKYKYIKKNKEVIDLLQSIFQFEEERISIKNIRNHPWLKY